MSSRVFESSSVIFSRASLNDRDHLIHTLLMRCVYSCGTSVAAPYSRHGSDSIGARTNLASEGRTVAKEDRGFASMDRAKQREIASKGGRAAHQKGTAHEWTPEEAREAGRKGGIATHQRKTADRQTPQGDSTPDDATRDESA